jgi:hypothetical protein
MTFQRGRDGEEPAERPGRGPDAAGWNGPRPRPSHVIPPDIHQLRSAYCAPARTSSAAQCLLRTCTSLKIRLVYVYTQSSHSILPPALNHTNFALYVNDEAPTNNKKLSVLFVFCFISFWKIGERMVTEERSRGTPRKESGEGCR